MYDTATRVALVKTRVRENVRRRRRREVGALSAACMLLSAALMQTAGMVVGPGRTHAQGEFGAMLLREDAGGYVLVGVSCFAARRRSPRSAFGSEGRKDAKTAGQASLTRENRR